jgi:acyl-CoA synthetase (AMP-forming)/AMP-acid ligase II
MSGDPTIRRNLPGARVTPSGHSFVDILRERATKNGDQIAYTFLPDGAGSSRSLTWAQLHRHASALCNVLSSHSAAGQPVLLMLPSGLEFIEALFGCWYAGAIAVPVSLPRHQRVKHRLQGMLADCGARLAVGTNETRQLTWIDPAAAEKDAPQFDSPARPDQTALLQYTSGSTGSPRGVVVTHANLINNSANIAAACGHQPGETIGGWLPLFHDMGLVGVLQAAFCGAHCAFMPPERFLMRPRSWLQMISDYRIVSSPAPNFAYDLCVEKIIDEQKAGLDLSHWRNALNGSEPVRAATLHRFADAFASCGFQREAFFPCYGLAEATLFVSGPSHHRDLITRAVDGAIVNGNNIKAHVGCGQTWGDTQIAIVNSETFERVPAQSIGEIWLSGGSCGRGYWKNPDASAVTFYAKIRSVAQDDQRRSWLRTGDLGMMVDGHLFITGRLRELIVIAGRNHFPVDLERTAENAHPAIAASGVAAFSIDVDDVERLIIVAEIKRELARPGKRSAKTSLDVPVIVQILRAAIAAEHEVALHDIVLLNPGALPRTTSGKLNHLAARDAYINRTLDTLEPTANASALQ